MTEKDKIILKSSGLAVIDSIVNSLEVKFPGVSVAWSLSKSLFGAGLELRQQRALEWVEMIRDNLTTLTAEIVSSPEFQDGFVYALEQYIRERNEEKRKIMQNIFLGFSKAEDKSSFPIERFTHTLSQLNPVDIKVLGDVDTTKTDLNYQIYGNESTDYVVNIFNLIHLGLLQNDTGSRMGPVNSPFVRISEFGKDFVSYLVS